MIFSFSVPENDKNRLLIDWYKTIDSQERSRKFRSIFMTYLKNTVHTMEIDDEAHISQSIKNFQMDRMDITSSGQGPNRSRR